MDTAGATATMEHFGLRELQWVDDGADIADDDDLVLAINGATITGKIALTANTVNDLCVWRLGPFNPPLIVSSFTLTTIDHGVLLLICDENAVSRS